MGWNDAAKRPPERWLAAFGEALAKYDVQGVAALFADECYWRDLVAFTWNIRTSEGRGELKQLATAEKYQVFHLPDNVGGRFSVLSAVGLLPAALIGLDIRKLLKGAAAIAISGWKTDRLRQPGHPLHVWRGHARQRLDERDSGGRSP